MYYPQSLTHSAHSNMLNAFSNLHAPVREKMLCLVRVISRPALRAHLSDQYQNICAKHLLMKTLFKPTSKSTSFTQEFAFITRKNSLSIKCATFYRFLFPACLVALELSLGENPVGCATEHALWFCSLGNTPTVNSLRAPPVLTDTRTLAGRRCVQVLRNCIMPSLSHSISQAKWDIE